MKIGRYIHTDDICLLDTSFKIGTKKKKNKTHQTLDNEGSNKGLLW